MATVSTDPRSLLLHFARNGAYESGAMELLTIERGEGAWVFDSEGRRHLDGLSSLYCAQLGYSYGEEMAAVAGQQLSTLPFATNWGVAHPAALALADKLAEVAPGALSSVFFTSGGSESVESAWKIVRHFHIANGEPQRMKVIARDRAYHGVSLGALALTGVPGYKEPFGRPAIDCFHVSNTNDSHRPESGPELTRVLLAEIEDVIAREGADTIAMIIAEPVQNAGGCLQPPEGYWPGLREICDRHGILLCADEVITGFGRLGEWFGHTRFDAEPDLITTAKGLTSAYAPMGAVIVSDRVAAPLFEGKTTLLHGITFGGHPLAAALGLKSMEIFERDGILENVRAMEPRLAAGMQSLTELPIATHIRGSGFFWAVELAPEGPDSRFDAEQREDLLRGFLPGALIRAGLIARGDDRGDTVIQVAPPLIADEEIVDGVVERLRSVLVAVSEHMHVPVAA